MKFIAVASGKGGVGKTTISANLGIALARFGRKVMIVDLDIAMPNLEIVTGIKYPAVGLKDVINGRLDFKEIIYVGPEEVRLVFPGVIPDGLTEANAKMIKGILEQIPPEIEIVLFDMPPGIEASRIIDADFEVLLVITPDTLSILDALNMKIAIEKRNAKILGVVLNMVDSSDNSKIVEEIEKSFGRIIGSILRDSSVSEAIKAETPFIIKFPYSKASEGIRELAKFLEGKSTGVQRKQIISYQENLKGIRYIMDITIKKINMFINNLK